ncbi:aminotransferase [Paraphotobacterium marinum]|uniref:alanine transaminase n=1 Tax=Paraphotobacterium marinum TaxID=1755811 RepID=A0A220VBE5_9GAMM|nr:aminotransferase class I/II-fold pyridoxal phosphate-dependent enzyme [Paraphotobacterium marinum]ASK77727.1 aminotransferase [Paraphotobacterium marinum]
MEKLFNTPAKFEKICYDLRGPILEKAEQLESNDESIIKLNIGNTTPFGYYPSKNILNSIQTHLSKSSGYGDSQGLIEARLSISNYVRKKYNHVIDKKNIFIGNGVSELILMSMQAFLEKGDEILVPSPDYPLWTASISLAGGHAVHYTCDYSTNWFPDLDSIKSRISKKTKGIVLINPNNPTGAVYSKSLLQEIVKICKKHNIIIFSDEIYENILFDNYVHHHVASFSDEVPCITFSGLSKSHHICGFRVGWMMITDRSLKLKKINHALNMLASMRLCPNIPMQFCIQPALEDILSKPDYYRSINHQLAKKRDLSWDLLNKIPGISCIKPNGALYLFPRIDKKFYNIKDDEKLVLDFLIEKKVLIVHGKGFHWHNNDHFRFIFLPSESIIQEAIERFRCFLKDYSQ